MTTVRARTGYTVQVDVLDAQSLRLRVFAVGSTTATIDRTAQWSDVIYDYRTAQVN